MDADILALRTEGLSCIVIAERLSITESRVWTCLRRHGRTHEFRAKQRNAGHSKCRPLEVAIYPTELAKLIHLYGSMTIEEAVGGGYIASFGDEPGTAQPSMWEAIKDAGEAAEMEIEEAANG